jgi:DNA repair protein RecO (recombination protein O)
MNPGKIDRQPAYVLHSRPYRETSLLLEILTPGHGRVALVARGARRPRSDLRGTLLPFQPLALSWFGKNEVRTLHVADWQGGVPLLSGLPLICGFYINELMMHLTVRDDPHPETWQIYDQAIRGLAAKQRPASVLRRFELDLVRCLGYAPQLEVDADGAEIDPLRIYGCAPGQAPLLYQGGEPQERIALVRGATLLALANTDFSDETTQREARGYLRLILSELLGPETRLATRELLQSLNPLSE